MATPHRRSHPPGAEAPGDDSAVAALRHIEEERGHAFNEAEYREMRQSVVEELARGAQCRPFTLFTFAAVGLLLLAFLVVGLVTSAGNTAADYALAIVSAAGLAVWGYVFWSYLRGIRQDALRSLDERLAELEELQALRLLSPEEYEYIRASILNARQRSRKI
jgi:hypothetical protein